MDEKLKQNLSARETWLRGFYIVLFTIAYMVAEVVLVAVVVFQFLATLFTGGTNERLLKLGQSLSTFVYQILRYVTFNTDARPYPFGAWPKGEPVAEGSARPKARRSRKKTGKTRAEPPGLEQKSEGSGD
ncbi:MAG: DUF4389 domain-containing protein [Chromatiales bacterium]|jgi:hypothetical protein